LSAESHINAYRSVTYRIALFQFLATLAIAGSLWAIAGARIAGSAFLAGAINSSTTVYMGRKVLSAPLADPHQHLATLYVAEAIKLAFTATFFCLAFLVFNVHGGAFLGTYAATVVVYAAVLALPSSRR
jgi:F0F1-type ATP synthase assembly protein I